MIGMRSHKLNMAKRKEINSYTLRINGQGYRLSFTPVPVAPTPYIEILRTIAVDSLNEQKNNKKNG